ncbi:hypothetical protein WJX81_004804 [Elliptochloris bilobata]|uniref:non-specific serine/threonine protein kinase n=1 Tax=Elliptochloris bilobata TaxID=381761 RepID=A0AAW1RMC0_9CHLO
MNRGTLLTCCIEDKRGSEPKEAAQLDELTLAGEASPAWAGDYKPGDVLGKYRVLDVIGRGSNGVTYKAEDEEGRIVAVKALSLRRMASWKALELFEREAATLKGLAHPAVPRYVDYFEQDNERDRGFFLVQDLAEGRSLAELVASGWRADEAEVSRIARELLEVLQYLGDRRPPVTHRDVKPENVVLGGGRAGGRVFLVDFGGVQAAAANELAGLGSTVIGTYGYMAPEQFRGAAQPASDLYGLGGTLLYLLTGRPPSAFPQDRLRLEFRDSVQVSERLAALLEGLLEPLVEERLSAAEALALLRDDAALTPARGERQLPGARAKVTVSGSVLEVAVPRAALLSGNNAGMASFALVWNGTIAVWTASALAAGSLFAAAFSLPFWVAGAQVARDAFGSALSSERLVIRSQTWSLTRDGLKGARSGGAPAAEGRTRDLRGATVITTGYVNGVPRTQLELLHGVERVALGTGLSIAEQLHLAERINAHVARLTGQAPPALPSVAALDRRPSASEDDLNDSFGDFGSGPRASRQFGVFMRRRGPWSDSSDGSDGY